MLLSLLTSPGKMLCVFLQSTMSKLSYTEHEDLYRISYSRQRLANSHCSCLQICNLCIHLWGVMFVYWASINHRAPWPCYLWKYDNSARHLLHPLFLSPARMTAGYKCLHVLKSQLWCHGIKWPWPRWYFWCGELIPFFMQKKQGSKLEWQKSNLLEGKKKIPNQNKPNKIRWLYLNISSSIHWSFTR